MKILTFFFAFYFIVGNLSAQSANTCPIKRMMPVDDSAGLISISEPKPGMTLISQIDSLFSFTKGRVSKIQKNNSDLFSISISLNDSSIRYYYISTPFVKEGSEIAYGQCLGLLKKRDANKYFLWVIVQKKGSVLSLFKHRVFISKICNKM